MKLYKYDVRGVGQFPMDMLRYDAAWPYEPDDCNKIVRSYRRRDDTVYTVTVCSHFKPTVQRWATFGWVVVSKGATK